MREIKFRAWDGKEMYQNVVIIDKKAYKRGYFANILNGEAKAGEPMQYTGLKDRSGKEIYDGDIYKWLGYEVQNGRQIRPERTGVVCFDIVELFKLQNIIQGNGTLEVIGNVYENPTLLEG